CKSQKDKFVSEMFRKIFTITLLMIVIIEMQKVECALRYLITPNCDALDHFGNCVKPYSMLINIVKKDVPPKRMHKDEQQHQRHFINGRGYNLTK
ncbi:hypothetical protein DOY81_008702, partial [Sarcophaga bullata]